MAKNVITASKGIMRFWWRPNNEDRNSYSSPSSSLIFWAVSEGIAAAAMKRSISVLLMRTRRPIRIADNVFALIRRRTVFSEMLRQRAASSTRRTVFFLGACFLVLLAAVGSAALYKAQMGTVAAEGGDLGARAMLPKKTLDRNFVNLIRGLKVTTLFGC